MLRASYPTLTLTLTLGECHAIAVPSNFLSQLTSSVTNGEDENDKVAKIQNG